jgi:GNAT superfamily N-acetyltransferase
MVSIMVHARQLLWTDEVHTWSELSVVGYGLGGDGRAPPVPEGSGLRLVAGSAEHLSLARDMLAVSRSVAVRRLAAGARWWLLVDGPEPVVSAWTFSRAMRMIGAPAGELILPPDVTFLEDVVTSPSRRRSGLGSLALVHLCKALRDEGASRLLTKVEVGNKASERMMAKVGFVPAATVRIRRRGLANYTWAVMSAAAVNTWVPAALGARNGTAAGGVRPDRSAARPETARP